MALWFVKNEDGKMVKIIACHFFAIFGFMSQIEVVIAICCFHFANY
jgi:hypothetical protein